MNKVDILKQLDNLKINKKEFTLLSSSALVLRGILDNAGDIDMAVTEKGLEELSHNYDIKPKGNNWYTVSDNMECVCDDMTNRKEIVEGYFVQDINDYLKYLKSSEREKDKLRISKVEEYINTKMR